MTAKDREKLLAEVARAIGEALTELGDYTVSPERRAKAFLDRIQPLITGLVVDVIKDKHALAGAIIGGVINPLWDLLESEAVVYIAAVIGPKTQAAEAKAGE